MAKAELTPRDLLVTRLTEHGRDDLARLIEASRLRVFDTGYRPIGDPAVHLAAILFAPDDSVELLRTQSTFLSNALGEIYTELGWTAVFEGVMLMEVSHRDAPPEAFSYRPYSEQGSTGDVASEEHDDAVGSPHRLTPEERTLVTASQQGRPVFARRGENWIVSYGGEIGFYGDRKGMHYIALLLTFPGREFHVIELVWMVEANPSVLGTEAHLSSDPGDEGHLVVQALLPDAGEITDKPGIRNLRQRFWELKEEKEEAELRNDSGAKIRIAEEMEIIRAALSAALGLGGKIRHAGSYSERARKMVSANIHRAIEKLGGSHPELRAHLRRALRTGVFLSYSPETDPDWLL